MAKAMGIGGNAVQSRRPTRHIEAATLFTSWRPGSSRGYEDPRWMTYKQAAENGWQVRKGEKGTHIEFWEVKAEAEEKNGEPSKDRTTARPPRKISAD